MANVLNKDPFTYAKDRRDFVEDLKSFHASRGTPFDQLPKLEGIEVDLYRLYRRVVDLGGWKKVNHLVLWDDIVEEFNIPAACTNGAQALKYVYIRYLNAYEKVKLWGVSPGDDGGDQADGHSRKKVYLPLELIPQSYNYSQHNVTDAEREANKLSTDLVQHSDYDKLEMALRSGLANEVDFALNACLLMSAQQGKGALTLRLCKSRHLMALLLATVGVFEEGPASMESVMIYNWNNGESERDYLQFWLDVVKDEQMRESLQTKSAVCITGEKVGSEVLHLGRELGVKDVEGQRVTQLAVLVRNLSFEEVNQQLLASNQLLFRFLMLCVHSSYGNLRQLALDTLGNLAAQMVLQPVENTSTQLVMNLIQKSLVDDDKFVILRALEMLNKLCQLEKNEPVLTTSMEEGTYCRIVQLLMVRDVQLIVHTLEALYQLSALGETTTIMIAGVRNAVDILVSMITVDVQSFGPDAQRGIRVVECLPEDVVRATAGQSSTQQPSTYFIEAVDSDHAPETPAEPLEQPSTVNKTPSDVELTASNWLSSTYELKVDRCVPQAELYAEYQQMCKKFNMTRLLSLQDLVSTVKSTLPRVSVAEVDRGGGGKEAVLQGLCKRQQAKPFAILTGSANPSAEPAPSVAVIATQTCESLPPVPPKPQTAVASSASVGCQVASPAAACQSSGQGTGKASAQTSKTVSASSQQALKAKLMNHQHASSSTQQAVATSGKTPNGKQQTNHRKILPSTALQSSPSSHPASSNTSASSPVVLASSSSSTVFPSSSAGTSSTWITIPCSGQPFQQKNHQKSAAGKTMSRGEQTAESSMVKTLLAQKVCQQMGGAHPGSAVPPAAAVNPASFLCVSSLPQGHQAQQFRLQQLPLHSQSPAVQFQLQSQVSAAQHQTVTGQNPLHTVHIQQAATVPIQQAPMLHQQLAQSQMQQTLQQQAVAVQQSASQQATALQQKPVVIQSASQATTLQQQQPVAIQSSSQTPPQLPAQSYRAETLQQQPLTAHSNQRSWQEPQPAAQQTTPVLQPQSQSSILKHLMGTHSLAQLSSVYQMTQGQQTLQQPSGGQNITCPVTPQNHPAPPNVQASGKTAQLLSSSQQSGTVQLTPGGQNPSPTAQPCQAVSSQASAGKTGPLALSQQSAGTVQIRVQGQQQQQQQQQQQVCQPQQVLQVQPHVHQQVIQMNGQHYILRQHVLQQPRQQQQQIQIQCRVPGQQQQQQTLQLPGGQIVLRGSQPVQVGPQQQIVVQQAGQPAQLVVQGQSGLQHILQQPVQQMQAQGQAVRIQGQPLVIQLPMYGGWPGTGMSKVVSVCGANTNASLPSTITTTTTAMGHAGSAPQGGAMAYRAIVPRPALSTTPSPQFGQQAGVSTSVPQTGQQVQTPVETGVKQDPGMCSNGARSLQQGVAVKTGEGAGGIVHSACQAAQTVNALRGTVAASQAAAASVQTFAPSSLSVCRTSAASVSVPSVSACPSTVSVTGSLPSSSVPLSSQHMPTVQSSSSVKSGHGSPHTTAHTARYNGHVNGAKLHIPTSKELMCNGVDDGRSADALENKVNGVLGSPSSDEGEVPSPLMSLRVKKEITNGCLERCVPYLADSVTGCSKEWLQNLAQQSVQIKRAFSQDEDDAMDVDILPQFGNKAGQNGIDSNHKLGAWQRNGLVAHVGVKDTPVSVSLCRGMLTKQSSMDEISLDSTDSGFIFNKNGSNRAGGDFGNRLLISPDGSYDGDRSCDSRASSVTDFTNGETPGFRPIPTLCSTATSPSPPPSTSFSSSTTVGKGTKRKAATNLKKAPAKSKKQKSGGGDKKVDTTQTASPSQSVGTRTLVMEYVCEWAGCWRRFSSAGQVFVHVTKTHVPDLPELICRWEGCQPLRRKRWSLVTHVQDHHCTEAGQRAACQRRFLQAHKAVLPPAGPTQAMVYPDDAAQQAIQRFQRQPPFVEFTAEEKQSPLTKHIQLTSALTLRNIARYSSLGRRLIKCREEELSCAAMSATESSNALASCLWELLT